MKTFNAEEPRDFIDVYITEMKKEKDPKSSFFGKIGHENLVHSLVDLFFAGLEDLIVFKLIHNDKF